MGEIETISKREQVGQMYEELASSVYNFLVYFTGDRLAAEDLLQETFLRLLKAKDSFEGRSSRKTWVYQIAKNLSIDWARKKRWKPFASSVYLNQISSSQQNPEENVMVGETQQTVSNVIQQLRPNYRAVIILRAIEELSIAETVEVLGWSESKVKTTYHRALRQLADDLEAKGVSDDVTSG